MWEIFMIKVEIKVMNFSVMKFKKVFYFNEENKYEKRIKFVSILK